MKNGKIVLMMGLLMISSNLFGELDKSMNKATTNLYHATIAAVRAAITIGLSSYVVDFLLCRFDATKNMKNRGTVVTGACATLYALFLLSAEYQRCCDVAENKKRAAYLPVDGEDLMEGEDVSDQEDPE